MRYVIYKLTNPRDQVDMPAAFKWAVGKETTTGTAFDEAFRTRDAARNYVTRQGHCFLCGETYMAGGQRVLCGCEREAVALGTK